MSVKILLTVVLLLATGQSVPLRDNEIAEEVTAEAYRLPTHTVPIHYDVKLIPHIVEGNFTCNGETTIDIEVRESTNSIGLHSEHLDIDKSQTRLTRKRGDDANATSNYAPKRHDYNERTHILTLIFDEPLESGMYSLSFKFVGVIGYSRGFYRSFYTDKDGNKVWLALTHFQPITARRAFPCWDEPIMKATFKFSIKHYPNYTALSNMPSRRSEVDAADGKVWTYFDTTPVMPTNILGFVVADYDHVSNSDGAIKIWSSKHLLSTAAFPLDIAERATRELEKFTNITVPVPKMDHVTAPHYSSRATENWGMIVYKYEVLLEDPNILLYGPYYTNYMKLYNTMTITHELAHQWFGNLVSPVWWDCLWLSEGISTYLKFYITDKFLKEWRLMDFFVVNIQQIMFTGDSHERAVPININITLNPYEAYTSNTYTKSAILLRMLSHFMREDVFRNGLIKYLQAHEYSNAAPDDLWKAMQDALDESDVPHNDFKVKEVMDTWFAQAGHPIVTIDRDYATGDVKATQKRSRLNKSNSTEENVDALWWIPLNFATRSNLDFSSTLATHWLKPQDESTTIKGIDVDDWIIVNKQQSGYYRVNYDVTNWKLIAVFLNSDNYDKIPVLNRAQIIADAFFMMRTEQLDHITFLEIINYLSHEIDPIAWYSVIECFKNMDSRYLQIPEGAEIFKPFFYKLTHKVFEHIGFDEHPDDDIFTRTIKFKLAEYACKHGHPKCQAKATAKLLTYIEDPTNADKMSPYSPDWILCYGLMKANESIWDQFLHNETLNSYLDYLGCTESADIIEKHMNHITEVLRSPKSDYVDRIFNNMLKNPSNIDMAIDFFIDNFDVFIMYQHDLHISKIIQNSFKKDPIEKIKAFIKQRGIAVDDQLISDTEQRLTKMKDNLSKLRSALESNQFCVTMHMPLNNSISQTS